jgi:hypothetical protein
MKKIQASPKVVNVITDLEIYSKTPKDKKMSKAIRIIIEMF